MWIVLMFILLIMVYLSVCFLTLLERKILGYVQNRKGPNKILVLGFVQPVIDGGKLLFKYVEFNFKFIFISLMFLVLMGVVSLVIVINWYLFMGNFFVYIIFISVLMVYMVFMLGWESLSVYGVMGGLRSSSQMIAYDVILFFLFIFMFMMMMSMGFNFIYCSFFLMDFILLWLLVVIIETNRSPYDFAEGESELVSGFNVEYLGVLFAFLFIAEYGMILMFSWVTSFIFLNFVGFVVFIFMIIMIRGFIPRSRYDLMMVFCWKYIFIYLSFMVMKIILCWLKIFL